MVVLQIVRIVWTKASRGAPHSTVRNALPRAFALNSAAGAYVLERHFLVESEAGKFAPQQVERATSARVPVREGELLLEATKDALELGLQWRPHMDGTGEPPRPEKRRAVSILLGQTARLVINGRHASSSGQWYTEDTFNVALVEELQPELFLGRPPHAIFSLQADLF